MQDQKLAEDGGTVRSRQLRRAFLHVLAAFYHDAAGQGTRCVLHHLRVRRMRVKHADKSRDHVGACDAVHGRRVDHVRVRALPVECEHDALPLGQRREA